METTPILRTYLFRKFWKKNKPQRKETLDSDSTRLSSTESSIPEPISPTQSVNDTPGIATVHYRYQAPFSSSTTTTADNRIKVQGNHNTVLVRDATEGKALELLSKHSNPNAELNSAARYPPPKCHPETRHTLLTTSMKWLTDPKPNKKMLWLYGAAGVGKSAFAQTLAENARDNKMLVGVFFFSRPNNRDDPNTVFPTIAYQFSTINKDYQRHVGKILTGNSHILTSDFRVQFQKLIVEPLRQVQKDKRVIIILDGLDECKEEDDQCDIIEQIIQGIRHTEDPLPALWVICSRPEHHLKNLIERRDIRQLCRIEELRVDSEESKDDMERYIRAEFLRIQKKYAQAVGVDWPGEAPLGRIIKASSGLFACSSAIIRFIDDPKRPDPDAQLETVMKLLGSSNMSPRMTRNPLGLLDALYTRILEEVPDDVLDDTLLLLHSRQWIQNNINSHVYVQDLANLLGLSRGRFYGAVGKLHSVLDIPAADDAPSNLIHFFHASFCDFLNDASRSQRFSDNGQSVSVLRRRAMNILSSDMVLSRLQEESNVRDRLSESLSFGRELVPWPYDINLLIGDEILDVVGDIVEVAIVAYIKLATDQDLREFDFNRFAYLRLKRSLRLKLERIIEICRPMDPESQHDKDLREVLNLKGYSKAKPLTVENLAELDQSGISHQELYAFVGYGPNAVIAIITYMSPQAASMYIRFLSSCHPSTLWPQYTELQSYIHKGLTAAWFIRTK